MPEQTFEWMDGFALDHVHGGVVVECTVGFSSLAAATLVAELDLLRHPEVEQVDVRSARLKPTSAMVVVRGQVVARVGRGDAR